jgi:hypothetical protein
MFNRKKTHSEEMQEIAATLARIDTTTRDIVSTVESLKIRVMNLEGKFNGRVDFKDAERP